MTRVALLLPLLLAACMQNHQTCPSPAFDTQGHRGARAHRPENTLPAFAYALSKGVKTLELDLAVSSDGVLVLSHDPILETGRCKKPDGSDAAGLKIHQTTLAELRTLDCGSTQHPDFPNQQTVPGTVMPTLEEVIALAEQSSASTIRYNMEPKMDPKWDSTITPDAPEFVTLLEDVLAQTGVAARTTVESFDPRPLRELSRKGSTLPRLVLFPSDQPSIAAAWVGGNWIENAQFVGAHILGTYAPITVKPFVDAAHAQGLAVVPWTVNDEATMRSLIAMGVDGLISDDPDLLLTVVKDAKPTGGVCY